MFYASKQLVHPFWRIILYGVSNPDIQAVVHIKIFVAALLTFLVVYNFEISRLTNALI